MRSSSTHAPRRARAVLAILVTSTAALWASGTGTAQTTAPPAPPGAPSPPTGTVPATPPPPPGTVPLTPPPPPGTTPTPPPTPTVPAGPPTLDSLRLARVVSAQQGHARFLVGVRVSSPSRLRVQVTSSPGDAPVRTVVSPETHPAGRAYVLIEATNEQRFQIPAGGYRVSVTATDDRGQSSTPLAGTFRLMLTPPRGRLDVFTVPLWPSIARQLRVPATGVLVAALTPGGTAVTAGVRKGDVITAVNGRRLRGPGTLTALLRALPASQQVPVDVLRSGRQMTFQVTPRPDWEPAPSFEAPLRVIARRDPTILAYAYAQARQLVDAGRREDAQALIDRWPPAWRRTAPFHLLQGDILYGDADHTGGLGAFNRAARADPAMSAARFGQGVALAALDRPGESVAAFTAAVAADPGDAVAQSFRAYLLVRTDAFPQALDAANRAVALDRLYEDAHIARALALIGATRTSEGVAALKRGLALISDRTRAEILIAKSLEPNEP